MKSKKQQKDIIARSSTAKYLTFISATGESEESIELRYENENIWMHQKLMAELYGVSVQAIDQHVKTLIKVGELDKATNKQYLIVQNEEKQVVQRKVDHYNLQFTILHSYCSNIVENP